MADSTNVVSDFQFIAGSIVFASLAVLLFVLFNRKSTESEPESKNVENDSVKQESNRTVSGKKNKKGGHEKQKKEQKAAYGHRWLLTTLKGHSGTVLNLDFSGNGKYLASCADGGSICWKGGVGGNPRANQSRRQQVNHQQNQPQIINNLQQPNNHSDNYTESENHNNNNRNHKKNRRNNVKMNTTAMSGFEPIPVIKTNILWPNFYGAGTPLQVYCAVVLQGLEVYQQLSGYILTRDEMQRCGYPIECPNTPGKIEISNSSPRKDVETNKPNLKPEEKLCYRCNSKFIVTQEGNYEADDTCLYHFGRFKPADCVDPKTPASVYSCCAGAVDSPGCAFSRFHIAKQASDNSRGFVKTREKRSNSPKGGVYALDCEMCYTWAGLEVTKVTVVGPDGFVVYDSLVLPEHPIVDYNTNYSGITANDMKNVKTTLNDVHAVLLKLFSSNTILIGHGLENDLKALKLLHETIIDTSVIFPHYYGLPYRRSLKSLMNSYLKKTIQDGTKGHDSAEDARACMELMLWKVLQDRQMR